MAITDPTDITGCVLWLDPTTLTESDGDPIGTWADQSVEGNDATASGADRPEYHDGTDFYHEEPVVRWNDTGQRMTVAADASLDNGEVTYAVVVRCGEIDVDPDPLWIFNKVNTNASTIGMRADDAGGTDGQYEVFFRLNGSEGTVRTLTSRGPVREAWTVMIFRYDGSTGEFFLDYALSDSISIAGAIDTDNSDILAIGNHSSVDVGWAGEIGDFVVYDNAISDEDMEDLVDHLLAKYPNSQYTKTGTAVSGTDLRHCQVRTASETGLSDNQMLIVDKNGDVDHYTSPTGDPHNWTLQNSAVLSDGQYRTIDFVVDSGTWYVYVDHAASNGEIELWTGAAVTSLTEHASSPVITGSAGDHPRVPGVIKEGSSWTMLVDVRTDSVTGNTGHIDRYTSSDGVSWTKDVANSPVLESTGTGFEATDVGHPSIFKNGTGDYILAYAGFNGNHHKVGWFPHEIGLATSTDLITFTRTTLGPALTHQEDNTTDLDIVSVSNPCIWNDGTNLVIYYSGFDSSIDIEIYYATGGEAPTSEISRSVASAMSLTSEAVGQNGLEESVSNALSFIQTLTYRGPISASASSPISASQEAIRVHPESVSSAMSLTSDASLTGFTYNRYLPSGMYDGSVFNIANIPEFDDEVLDLIQTLTYTGDFAKQVASALGLTQEVVVRQAVVNKSIEHLIPFTFSVGREVPVSVSSALSLTQTIERRFIEESVMILTSVANAFTTSDALSELSLTGVVQLAADRIRAINQDIGINQSLLYYLASANLECLYTPQVGEDALGITPPSIIVPTIGQATLTLTYPYVSPTTTLILENPEFGDTDTLSFERIQTTSRGGTPIFYSDPNWPKYQTLNFQIRGLKREQRDNFQQFVIDSIGAEIGLKDHENRQWRGIIMTPDVEFTHSGRDNFITTFDFEGVLV